MGWVGVGALIATACCLLYRCPPNTWAWAWALGLWARVSRSESKPQSLPASAEAEKDVKDDVTSKTTTAEPVSSPPGEEEDNDTGTAQTTPKATAVAAPPAADIPTFNLEDGDALAEKKSPGPSQTDGFVKPPLPSVSAASQASVSRTAPSASSSSLMPPPPPPRLRTTTQQQQQQQQQAQAAPRPNPAPGRFPAPPRPTNSNIPLRPLPSAASSLRVPQSSSGLSSSTLAPVPRGAKPGTSSRRVVLEPGHSPLDWAALTSNPNNNLRGKDLPPTLIKVTPSMLKEHNGRKGRDVWISYQGKVYNITPYLPYHPGGKGELLRGAGKDSGKLFMEIHPWVNWDGILGECLVGILVSENEGENNAEANSLDAMD